MCLSFQGCYTLACCTSPGPMLTLDRTQVLQYVFCPSKGVLARQPPQYHGTAADVLVVLVGWDFPSGFTWLAGNPAIDSFTISSCRGIYRFYCAFLQWAFVQGPSCSVLFHHFFLMILSAKTFRYLDLSLSLSPLRYPRDLEEVVCNNQLWTATGRKPNIVSTNCRENLEGQS